MIPWSSRIPPLSAYPVTISRPSHAILAGSFVGIADLTSSIGPERVVVSVIGTSLARSQGLAFG